MPSETPAPVPAPKNGQGALPAINELMRAENTCEITQITSDGFDAPVAIVWNSEAPVRDFELYIANILKPTSDDLTIRTSDTGVSGVVLKPGHYCVCVRPMIRSRYGFGYARPMGNEGVWSFPQYITVNASVNSFVLGRNSDQTPSRFGWYPVVGAVSYRLSLSNTACGFTLNARIDDAEAASFTIKRPVRPGQYELHLNAFDREGVQTPVRPLVFDTRSSTVSAPDVSRIL